MKQETFYVKITGSETKLWYATLVGLCFPVYEEDGEYFVEGYFWDADKRLCIQKSDCTRVYLQEQATDIDGEPLECGDEVDVHGEKCVFLCVENWMEHKYLVRTFTGNYMHFRSVRKIKPEPDINDYINWLDDLVKKYGTETDFHAIAEIKKHMEEKEQPQKGYFEVEQSDPIEEAWEHIKEYINKPVEYSEEQRLFNVMYRAIKKYMEAKK